MKLPEYNPRESNAPLHSTRTDKDEWHDIKASWNLFEIFIILPLSLFAIVGSIYVFLSRLFH